MDFALLIFFVALAALVAWILQPRAPRRSLESAQLALRAGTAVLVDVREPAEWIKGVADGSALLPYSDLKGAREKWGPFLERNRERRLLLYCGSGVRSARAAQRLQAEGVDAVDVGALRDWRRAGWPVVPPRDLA
jgi:rhodanese-related sulfurtransferase